MSIWTIETACLYVLGAKVESCLCLYLCSHQNYRHKHLMMLCVGHLSANENSVRLGLSFPDQLKIQAFISFAEF